MNRPDGRRRVRRFTLLDGVILIVASAVGFAGLRGTNVDLDWQDRVLDTTRLVAGYALMIVSVLVTILRLRPPRPPLRRVIWRPGAAACLAAAAYGFLFNVMVVANQLWGGRFPDRSLESWIWWIFAAPDDTFALIVAVVWGMLAIAGRWRSEPSWIDRLGRLVGSGWIFWLVTGVFADN